MSSLLVVVVFQKAFKLKNNNVIWEIIQNGCFSNHKEAATNGFGESCNWGGNAKDCVSRDSVSSLQEGGIGGMESDCRSSILDQDLKGVKAEPVTWKCICDELVCGHIPSSPKAQKENAQD